MFLQSVKMSDEVTVSSLPHPISMFFLGIFAITIIFMLVEVIRFKKDNDKMKSWMEGMNEKIKSSQSNMEVRLNEVSKKIDSRVDKALLTFKKQNQ
jgi:hypothetical protein